MSDDLLSYHRIAMRIVERMPTTTQGGRTLLITSARRGEGKSFIAKALAGALRSQIAGPVALVTCSESALRTTPDDPNVATWSKLACVGDADSDMQRIKPPPNGSVSRIPYGDGDESTLFRQDRVARAFDLLRSLYAFTLFDGPVLTNCGFLGPSADGVLLVVNASRTRREIVKSSLRSGPVAPTKVLGVVLNERPSYVPRWLYRWAL
jgi:hypothetical protein